MNEKEFFDEIRSYKLIANKSLGQNFLVNSEIASKIVETLDIQDNDKVLEIGSGLDSPLIGRPTANLNLSSTIALSKNIELLPTLFSQILYGNSTILL